MRKKLTPFVIFICSLNFSFAQSTPVSIRGAVLTSDDQAGASVTINLKNTHRSTLSNEQGIFELRNLKPGDYTLSASLVGYETIEVKVTVEEGKTAQVRLKLGLSKKQLDEVVITAYRNRFNMVASDDVAKMPLTNLENAQVYTTVTKDLARQQLAFSVDDALKNAPGVTKLWDATNRVGYGGSWMTSRGFATQVKARNGIYGNVIASTDMANAERIEVIKGPSATLFGNVITSYGGLINRITKKPYQQFGGEVDYSVGSYGMNRVSADVNIPLDKEKRLLLRTNAVLNRQNSFQDYGFSQGFSVTPSLTFQVNDRLRINFDAEISGGQNSSGSQVIYFLTPSYAKSVIGAALGGFGFDPATINAILSTAPSTMKDAYGTDRADGIGLDYKRSYLSNDLLNKTGTTNFFGEVNYKINSSWTSQTLASKGSTSSDGYLPYFYLLPDMLPNFIASIGTGNPSFGQAGHENMARMVWQNVGNDNSLELQQNFIGDFHIGKMRNRVVAGLDYFNYNARISYNRFVGSVFGFPFTDAFDIVKTSGTVANYYHLNKGKVDSAYAAGTPSSLNYNSNNNIYSAFIHDVFNLTDALILSAGLRVDHFSDKGSYDGVSGGYANGYNQTKLAPKFGLIWQPVLDQVTIFGNFQSGFTNKTGVDATGKRFKPEEATQWEGGVKVNMLKNRLYGSVSYYDITVKDIVRTDINNPFFNLQDGQQQSRGIEVELNASPVNGLNIMAGYGYNNSKLTKSEADVEGLRPVATGPEHSFNGWLAYRFTNNAVKGLNVGFGANYAGESFAVNSRSDGSFILPAYTLLNALVAYEHPRFRIAVKLNNIADKKYWVGYTTMNPQMGRQLIGSIGFKF